jgi:hypothetical protein
VGIALYSFSAQLRGISKDRSAVCLLQSSACDGGSNFILEFRLQLIISYVRLIYSSSHLSCQQSSANMKYRIATYGKYGVI